MDPQRLMMTADAGGAAGTAGATTRTGLAALGAAVALGLCGDALLRVGPPAANGTLWLAAFLTVLVSWRRRVAQGTMAGEVGAAGVALVFALGLAWRDSIAVKLLDLGVVAAMVALSFLRLLGARAPSASMSKLAGAGVLAGLHASFGMPVLVAADISWREVRRDRRSARLLAAARGVGIAAPLLAVFGAMLAAADAIFAHIVTDVLRIDVQVIMSHLVVAGFFAWVVAGVLRGTLITRPVSAFWSDLPRPPWLGVLEVAIVLGLLDLLFLGFVAVQVRYLFGGARYLISVPALTYAEYARDGFFELVSVAALAIPLLLATHWLLRRDGQRDEKVYRALAAVMALLLAVMMASALRRLLLYTGEYGLSQPRVYTLAFMGWLALVLVWFSFTVLRGRRGRFAFGALAAGVVVVAVLNVCNVDGLIVKVNLSRAGSGRFDACHAASLSADAIPALVAGLGALDAVERATVVRALARRWEILRSSDWRIWSAGRAAAVRALERGPAELRGDESRAEATRSPGVTRDRQLTKRSATPATVTTVPIRALTVGR